MERSLANGKCCLCKNPAPFNDSNGNGYLEINHIIWLSKGGRDKIENTIALCPTRHKKMQIVADEKDVKALSARAVMLANKKV